MFGFEDNAVKVLKSNRNETSSCLVWNKYLKCCLAY